MPETQEIPEVVRSHPEPPNGTVLGGFLDGNMVGIWHRYDIPNEEDDPRRWWCTYIGSDDGYGCTWAEAIQHGAHPHEEFWSSPTPDAYERACRALEKWRAEAERLKAESDASLLNREDVERDLDVDLEVSRRFTAGALDRIPETPTIDTREALQERLDQMRADMLGRRVREVWVEWASHQPNPKPSHLTPWDQLDEDSREVDRLIGAALAAEGRRETENAITWGTTCLNDARLLDACYEADMRREAAEKALAEAERRHEALLTQAEDYVREISEARGQERAVLADLIALASSRNGPNRRERLERARAVLGESGNA